MLRTASLVIAALFLTTSYVEIVEAKSVRLRAKYEDPANEQAPAEGAEAPAEEMLLPEFHADYREKKNSNILKVRVQNLEIGTEVTVFVDDVNIGSAVVEANDVGTEAALDFKKGEWPSGLPTTLSAGMMVSIFSGEQLLFEAPFEAK